MFGFLLLALVLVHPRERFILFLQGVVTLEPFVLLVAVFLLHLLHFL